MTQVTANVPCSGSPLSLTRLGRVTRATTLGAVAGAQRHVATSLVDVVGVACGSSWFPLLQNQKGQP